MDQRRETLVMRRSSRQDPLEHSSHAQVSATRHRCCCFGPVTISDVSCKRLWMTTNASVLVIISVAIGFLAGRRSQARSPGLVGLQEGQGARTTAVEGVLGGRARGFRDPCRRLGLDGWLGMGGRIQQLDRGPVAIAVTVIGGSVT